MAYRPPLRQGATRWLGGHFSVSAALGLALTLTVPAHAATTYYVTDLGMLPSFYRSAAWAINASGQVTGSVEGNTSAAFRWTPGLSMQELELLPGAFSGVGLGINDSGDVVGSNGPNASLWEHDGTGAVNLAGRSLDAAAGINNAGQIVGRYALNSAHSALWGPSTGVQEIGDFPGGRDLSAARAINSSGQVVGVSGSTNGDRAFLWSADGGMRDLGDLARDIDYSAANGMNDQGQVVGFSTGTDGYGAFLWDATNGMRALHPPEGSTTAYAYDINNVGQAVGFYVLNGSLPFIWEEGDGMIDLNTLVDAKSFLQPEVHLRLLEATAINDAGQIVVNGVLIGGAERAFLLTPVPEPGTTAMMVAGLAMLGVGVRRVRRGGSARRLS